MNRKETDYTPLFLTVPSQNKTVHRIHPSSPTSEPAVMLGIALWWSRDYSCIIIEEKNTPIPYRSIFKKIFVPHEKKLKLKPLNDKLHTSAAEIRCSCNHINDCDGKVSNTQHSLHLIAPRHASHLETDSWFRKNKSQFRYLSTSVFQLLLIWSQFKCPVSLFHLLLSQHFMKTLCCHSRVSFFVLFLLSSTTSLIADKTYTTFSDT